MSLVNKNLKRAFELLAEMPSDFFADGRHDPLPKNRKAPV